MGRPILPPRRYRRPRRTAPRPAPPAALPPLPRGLRLCEVAHGHRLVVASPDYTTIKLEPGDLTTDQRGRLLQRAEHRLARLRAAQRRVWGDLFWLRAELALVLPGAHPAVAGRWRETARRLRGLAEAGEQWARRLEVLILTHEPATDRWLRARLAELEGPTGPGRPT